MSDRANRATLTVCTKPYKVHHLDLSTNLQKEPWFLEVNPNGCNPALTDTLPDGKFSATSNQGPFCCTLQSNTTPPSRFHTRMVPWSTSRRSAGSSGRTRGLGPMQGQANHFRRYAPEKERQGYSLARYRNESRRLYGVLESQLSRREPSGPSFLVSDRATITDVSVLSWVLSADWAGVDINDFPKVRNCETRILPISGVKEGTEMPKSSNLKQMLTVGKEEYASRASRWIVGDGK